MRTHLGSARLLSDDRVGLPGGVDVEGQLDEARVDRLDAALGLLRVVVLVRTAPPRNKAPVYEGTQRTLPSAAC